jgi:hypothetical protein
MCGASAIPAEASALFLRNSLREGDMICSFSGEGPLKECFLFLYCAAAIIRRRISTLCRELSMRG